MSSNEINKEIKFSKICRLCMNEPNELVSVFSKSLIEGNEILFSEMIIQCASVQVFEEDNLPKGICLKCIERLNNAYSFRKLCENTEHNLYKLLNEIEDQCSKNTQVKSEFPIDIVEENMKMEINDTTPVQNFPPCKSYPNKSLKMANHTNFSQDQGTTTSQSATSALLIYDPNSPANVISNIDNTSFVNSSSNLEITNEISIEKSQEIVVNSRAKTVKSSKLNDFDLKNILDDHPIGSALLLLSSSNITLEAQWQSYLCEIIVVYFLKLKMVLVNEDFEKIAKKIIEVFPSECPQIYYVPPIKKKDSKKNKCEISKGKLVDKWRNINTIIRTLKNLKVNPLEIQTNEYCDNTVNEACSSELSKEWLVNNRVQTDVLTHWESSYDLRREEIKSKKYKIINDIFNDWPILKESIGCQLINYDFKKIYPDEEYKLILNWSNIIPQLTTIFYDKLSDDKKQRLQYLRLSDISDISKCVIQLEILIAILSPKPSKKKFIKTETDRKSTSEIYLQEIKNSIFLHIKITGDIQKTVDDRIRLMTKLKKPIQPFLIVIGQNELKLEKVYIQIDDFRYEVPTFLNGLDTLFKLFLTFDIAYPVESENVWYFFQWGIYQIKTKSDAQIPSLYNILNKLNKHAEKHKFAK